MSKEKGIKWFFDKETGEDDGPNDPIHEKFKGNPYYSIVRESIQNSLDAVDDESNPVEVEYSFFKISRLANDFPNFFRIENHIKGGKKYYPNNPHARRLYDEMLEYLNGNYEGNKKKAKIDCLRISDYNTKGMTYQEDENSDNYTSSAFYAFLRAKGVSPKGDSGAGGSFGFGKGAYFGLSPIRTVIVSTLTKNGNYLFQGKTRLTTHKGPNGEKLTASGYYDRGNGKPITSPDQIPDIFIRSKQGTDINVIGLQDSERAIAEMVKSVLNNFWLAIYEDKLAVKIREVEINRENLDEMIHSYYSEEIESGSINDYEEWTPLPYYKAVRHAEETPNFRVFEKKLNTLGKVKLYVYLKQGLKNRIAYLRKPKMVVFKKTNNKLHGYSGVLICENEDGNKLLRKMENPQHNEWSKTNYTKGQEPHPEGKKAEREISEFINDCLSELNKGNIGKKQNVLGLEEYLNIPEDLIGEEDLGGDGLNLVAGRATDELTEEETGLETTSKDESKRVQVTVTETKNIEDDEDSEYDEEGELDIVSGSNEETGGDQPGLGDSDNVTSGTAGSEQSKKILPIDYRVVAQRNNSIREHVLIINSSESTQNAEIEIKVGTDTEGSRGDNQSRIIESSLGEVSDHTIKNVQLSKGKNELKIRFEDDLKHSLNISAYAIE